MFAENPGVRCKITGLARDADGSPCCDEYTRCGIWKAEKERLWAHKRAVVAPKQLNTGTGKWV